jgi:hypothetical protein
VADWRIKKLTDKDKARKGIRLKENFLSDFAPYLSVETPWRAVVIKGTIEYYNTGILPAGLPLLSGSLWRIVISETKNMKTITEKPAKK